MKLHLSRKFWASLAIFSFIGQVAWVVENMYFNVFVYKMFNASARDISTMVAVSAVTATLTTLLIGAFSDAVGKRKVIICTGYLTWGLTILSFALIRIDVISYIFPAAVSAASLGVALVIIMDAVMTFFGSSANDAAFNAWLTDTSDETNRGAIEGINSMMPLIAVLAVFGGFMFFDLDRPDSWITIFLTIGILVMLIGIAGIFLIDEKILKPSESQNYFANIFYGFRPSVIRKNPVMYITLIAFAVFGISIETYMPYLIIYYEKSLGLEDYVLILAPAVVVAAVVTAFYGRAYDRFRFRNSIIPTILILMAGYTLLYFFKQTGLVFAGSLLMMTGYLSGMAVFGAMIRDYTPPGKAGLFQGLRIIGQVLIPGTLGPMIGASVLANASTITNSDGTRSFIPNQMIFLAAFVAAGVLWLPLSFVFRQIRNEHSSLLTPEGEEQQGIPWTDYPRPQLVRDSYLSLNGPWEFACSFRRRTPTNFPQQILVPFPPESSLSGIGRVPHKYEYLYYRKQLVLPEGFVQDKVLLHFGAVDQIASVMVNGVELVTHAGGYLPFTVDLTGHLQQENTIVLRVRDTLSHKLPYGKQRRRRGGMWYTPVSGIWQSVWLESVPNGYVRALKVTPAIDLVTVEIDSDAEAKTIQITTPRGVIEQTFSGGKITLAIGDPVHWTPENPHLYTFKIFAGNDVVSSYFALRTLEIRESGGLPRLCLNGKPYYFHGVLDQGYYSDGLYLPASIEGYRRDIATMKELGFNTLRKHVKIEPANYYQLCDQMGMVVFQDMPNLGHYSFVRDTALPTLGFLTLNDKHKLRTKAVKTNYSIQMQETIRHLFNHPSICLWTLFNEGWGQFDSDMHYQTAKQLDPTRFVNSTSGWFQQESSDVASRHLYFKPIEIQKGSRPVVLSEFGGYTLKLAGHAFSKNKAFGYQLYTDAQMLQNAVEKVYLDEVAKQIGHGLCASIYTQVSDVEDETNGFLTYDRRVLKVDKAAIRQIAEKLKID